MFKKRGSILSLFALFAIMMLFFSQSSTAFAHSSDGRPEPGNHPHPCDGDQKFSCAVDHHEHGGENAALVRVVHAAAGAGTVDVFVDGKGLISNFKFAEVTEYTNLPAGPHTIKVAPAGKGIDAAVITQDVTVKVNVEYTVAAVGSKDAGFSLSAFEDDNSVAGDMAKVKIYHLSPNAGPVNVSADDMGTLKGLTYKNTSTYLTLKPQSITFKVTATTPNVTVDVNASLEAGTVTSVFAVGLYKGDPALQFVTVKVNGLPGMPDTGSNPYALKSSTMPWMVSALALLLILSSATAGVVYRRRK